MTWGISFGEISVSLDCCITKLWHPINKNYVIKEEQILSKTSPFEKGDQLKVASLLPQTVYPFTLNALSDNSYQ